MPGFYSKCNGYSQNNADSLSLIILYRVAISKDRYKDKPAIPANDIKCQTLSKSMNTNLEAWKCRQLLWLHRRHLVNSQDTVDKLSVVVWNGDRCEQI